MSSIVAMRSSTDPSRQSRHWASGATEPPMDWPTPSIGTGSAWSRAVAAGSEADPHPASNAVQPTRLPTNRGNGYPQPNALTGYQAASKGIFPNFDCKPSGGEVNTQPPEAADANCTLAPPFPDEFGGGQAPNLYADP